MLGVAKFLGNLPGLSGGGVQGRTSVVSALSRSCDSPLFSWPSTVCICIFRREGVEKPTLTLEIFLSFFPSARGLASPVRPVLSALPSLSKFLRQCADKRKVAVRASRHTIFKLTMVMVAFLVQFLGIAWMVLGGCTRQLV